MSDKSQGKAWSDFDHFDDANLDHLKTCIAPLLWEMHRYGDNILPTDNMSWYEEAKGYFFKLHMSLKMGGVRHYLLAVVAVLLMWHKHLVEADAQKHVPTEDDA